MIECYSKIHHGPGHQSSTPCRLTGEHEVHEAVYGEFNQFARWKGAEDFSDSFDNPPPDPIEEPDQYAAIQAHRAKVREEIEARQHKPKTEKRPAPTVRFTCANWKGGDGYTGHHTGPCGSTGYLDVPAVLAATGGWRRWVINPANTNGEGWSVTSHYCLEPGDHDENSGSRFYDNVHEMLFCCGPCMVAYLLSMYLHHVEVDLVMGWIIDASNRRS